MLTPKRSDALVIETAENNAGIAEYLHFDEADQTFTCERLQDVQPILENAKDLSKEQNGKTGDLTLMGSFPQVLVENWLNIRNLTMKDFKNGIVDEFLNDPDHAYFRVWQGRA